MNFLFELNEFHFSDHQAMLVDVFNELFKIIHNDPLLRLDIRRLGLFFVHATAVPAKYSIDEVIFLFFFKALTITGQTRSAGLLY